MVFHNVYIAPDLHCRWSLAPSGPVLRYKRPCNIVFGLVIMLCNFVGHDGAGQMQHFVTNDGFNTFRLPVGWQFLSNDAESGTLNSTNFAKYDTLVQV